MKVLIYCSNLYLEYQLISNLNRENINYKKGYANLDNLNYFKKEIEYVKPTNIIYFFDKNNNIFENNVNNTINHMTSIIKILKFCKVKNIHFTYINYKTLFYNINKKLYISKYNEDNSIYNYNNYLHNLISYFFNDNLFININIPFLKKKQSKFYLKQITNNTILYDKNYRISNIYEFIPQLVIMIQYRFKKNINLFNQNNINIKSIFEIIQNYFDSNIKLKINNSNNSNNSNIIESYKDFLYNLNFFNIDNFFPNNSSSKNSIKKILYFYNKKNYIKKSLFTINENILNIKTILVTGGMGKNGSNFINYFCKKYPDISLINYDALYNSNSINNIERNIIDSKNYKFIKGNLLDYELTKSIFLNNTITHIINFASKTNIEESFLDPIQYTLNNVVGTNILLEINHLYNKNLIQFIHISINNENINHYINPYYMSKYSSELITESYINCFNLPIIIYKDNICNEKLDELLSYY